MIYFYNEDIDLPVIDTTKYIDWIERIIHFHGKRTGEVSFIFCSDPYLLQINKEYLNHDYFTDIITFNYNTDNELSGDIFISLDTVRENAKEYKVSFSDELRRVIIHGILHLVGFDDKTKEQKQIMRQKEEEAMNMFDS
ncbi:rRNA maturation RNase YbeY [Roseimarinus sediminis]|uniref:rRNA maturation RNase YbeY n=1 Tax=Roseimarinus sediminis TaxID=1610899 RepID=UPI003D19E9F3